MTDSTPTPNDAAPKGGLWARLKQHLLHPELTPHQVALSFALGFHICWNPLLGLHTALLVLLCLIFKDLHRPLMAMASFLNNPWTMVPIATLSAYAGNVVLGRGLNLNLASIDWHSLGWRSFTTREGFETTLRMFEPILVPYLVGGALLSLLALGGGYVVARYVAIRLRRIHFSHLHRPLGAEDSN